MHQVEEESADEQLEADHLQTFIFSATLSKDLQRNLKRRARFPRKGQKPTSTLGTSPETNLSWVICETVSDDLLLRLDFRDPEPEVVDLSPAGGVVSTLQESKVECLVADKVLLLLDTCKCANLYIRTRTYTCTTSCCVIPGVLLSFYLRSTGSVGYCR